MALSSIQDRTSEFRKVLEEAQKQQARSKSSAQRQSLLTDSQRRAANASPIQNGSANGSTPRKRGGRSEFARNAAQIGRGITGTMEKLERLARLAKRKTLFDDRPVEIAELTYVIKQDLASLNQQISSLQTLQKSGRPPSGSSGGGGGTATEQEGEHNKNVVVLLQGKLADVGVNFKEVLEVRTKNIQASRNRTDQFVSSVSSHTAGMGLRPPGPSASPLYSNTPPKPGTPSNQNPDLLNLDPAPNGQSALISGGTNPSDQQLLLMEEAAPQQNSYINMRGEAIDVIERTINELGSVFGQLASMVSEQGEMVQRIDANTEDVVENVEGAQRELMKYWGRVKGNRWLVAKMFGVLMVSPQPFCASFSTIVFFFPKLALQNPKADSFLLLLPFYRSSSYYGFSSPAKRELSLCIFPAFALRLSIYLASSRTLHSFFTL